MSYNSLIIKDLDLVFSEKNGALKTHVEHNLFEVIMASFFDVNKINTEIQLNTNIIIHFINS